LKSTEESISRVKSVNYSQQIFLKYMLLVLLDLTTLNLLNQYWDLVYIETFTISLLAALLLQVLMRTTVRFEEYIAEKFFAGRTSIQSKVARVMSTWAILFVSKLIILEIIDIAFGTSILFSGPLDGLVAFLLVVIVVIMVEQSAIKIYRSLEHLNKKESIKGDLF